MTARPRPAGKAEGPSRAAAPPGESVMELVARFELRGRADTLAYLTGTALAAGRRVELQHVESGSVEAQVDDGTRWRVLLRSTGSTLRAQCGCGGGGACPHAVAVAHALWLRHVTSGSAAWDAPPSQD